jgi:DNA gyrase/topoisomerase IV subunit B
MSEQNQYTEDNIRSLDWKEHIRMRPGMYIGKLGDGSSADDGIFYFGQGFSITVSMNLQWALEKLLR